MLLSLGAGCATSSPTYKRPAYVVNGVVAGLGALLIGSSAASRADNPGGDGETAPFVAVGGVMLVVGLGAHLGSRALTGSRGHLPRTEEATTFPRGPQEER